MPAHHEKKKSKVAVRRLSHNLQTVPSPPLTKKVYRRSLLAPHGSTRHLDPPNIAQPVEVVLFFTFPFRVVFWSTLLAATQIEA